MRPMNVNEAAAVELFKKLNPKFTASLMRGDKMKGDGEGNGDFTSYEVMLHHVLEKGFVSKQKMQEWCEDDIVTLELLEDPVMLPSGRSVSLDTYKGLSNDPETRAPIDQAQPIVSNKSLDAFMADPATGFFDPITGKPIEAYGSEKDMPVCCMSEGPYLGLTFNRSTLLENAALAAYKFVPSHKINEVVIQMNAVVTEKLNEHRSFIKAKKNEEALEEKEAPVAVDREALQATLTAAKNLFATQRNMEASSLLQTEIGKFNLENPIPEHAKFYELLGDILDVEFIKYDIKELSDAVANQEEAMTENALYVRLNGDTVEYLSFGMKELGRISAEELKEKIPDPAALLKRLKDYKFKDLMLGITEKRKHTHTRNPKRDAAESYNQAAAIYASFQNDISSKINLAALAVKAGKNYRDRRKKDGMHLLKDGEALVRNGLDALNTIDIGRVSQDQRDEITYIKASLYDELWYLLNKQVEEGVSIGREPVQLLAARDQCQREYSHFCEALAPPNDCTVLFMKARMHTAFTEKNQFNEKKAPLTAEQKSEAKALKKRETELALEPMTASVRNMPEDFHVQHHEQYVKMLIQWGVCLSDAISINGIDEHRADAEEAVRRLTDARRNVSGFNSGSVRRRIQALEKHLGNHSAVLKGAMEKLEGNDNQGVFDKEFRAGLIAISHLLPQCHNEQKKRSLLEKRNRLFDRIRLKSSESSPEDVEELLAVIDKIYGEYADVPVAAQEGKDDEYPDAVSDASSRLLSNLQILCAERRPSAYAASGPAMYKGGEANIEQIAINHILGFQEAEFSAMLASSNPSVFFKLAAQIVTLRWHKMPTISRQHGQRNAPALTTYCDRFIAHLENDFQRNRPQFSQQNLYKLLACGPLKGKSLPEERAFAHQIIRGNGQPGNYFSLCYQDFLADAMPAIRKSFLETINNGFNAVPGKPEALTEIQKDILQMYFGNDEMFPKLVEFIDKLRKLPDDPNACALIGKIENFITQQFGPIAVLDMYEQHAAMERPVVEAGMRR